MKYEWRNATKADLGKGYDFRLNVGDSQWDRRVIRRPSKGWELIPVDGGWQCAMVGMVWERAQVYAPVDESTADETQVYAPVEEPQGDQTGVFDFSEDNDDLRHRYRMAALTGLLANPVICHGDCGSSRDTHDRYIGKEDRRNWIAAVAKDIGDRMMEGAK